jgi:tetratricopeptide (TPR) repeat protein
MRLVAANVPSEAMREIAAAASDADAAADQPLREWIECERGSILVRAGRGEEAEALFTRLTGATDQPGDIAFAAARFFHLGGDLDRAARWYRAAFGRGARADVGRLKWELFEGLVFALGEQKRWNEALSEAGRFEKTYPGEAELAGWYRQYLIWRSGGAPQAIDDRSSPQDIVRYWTLEFALANGEPPDRLLRRVDAELPLVSRPVSALLRSFRAELLHRLGRDAESVREALPAYELLNADRTTDVEVRAHFDLVERRLHGTLSHRAH